MPAVWEVAKALTLSTVSAVNRDTLLSKAAAAAMWMSVPRTLRTVPRVRSARRTRILCHATWPGSEIEFLCVLLPCGFGLSLLVLLFGFVSLSHNSPAFPALCLSFTTLSL